MEQIDKSDGKYLQLAFYKRAVQWELNRIRANVFLHLFITSVNHY